tara:strand:+ start:475 stop:717 length:243 start_codon:yes stop_codon:yes gene_type:complete
MDHHIDDADIELHEYIDPNEEGDEDEKESYSDYIREWDAYMKQLRVASNIHPEQMKRKEYESDSPLSHKPKKAKGSVCEI